MQTLKTEYITHIYNPNRWGSLKLALIEQFAHSGSGITSDWSQLIKENPLTFRVW